MKKFMSVCLLGSVMLASTSFTAAVHASDTGAFVGGMLTSKVLGNMRARTEAEQQQAAAAQQQANSAAAVQQAPAAPAQKSVEQQMKELDSLAAGGYISKEEYQAKKQAIINSI